MGITIVQYARQDMRVQKETQLANKMDIIKKVIDWLDDVKLNGDEELTCHADETGICIKVWDKNNLECRMDARTKQERDRRHKFLIESRIGKQIPEKDVPEGDEIGFIPRPNKYGTGGLF